MEKLSKLKSLSAKEVNSTRGYSKGDNLKGDIF